jgi:exonuclease VII small subunit
MTKKTVPAESISDLGYADALTELEAILAELESSLVDVDTLATKDGRAANIVTNCRARLSIVRHDVDKVVAGLDTDLDDDQGDNQ